jgi:molybdopterin/thiamine biosynthesis adenylyltransferase
LRADIINKIKKVSIRKKFPDDTLYTSISVEHVQGLSKFFEVSGRQIEIAALEESIVPERYSRNMKSFSTNDQAILLKSRVSIVGLGGLGGAVTEILARIGIGALNLIDGETFEDSNLNRQFLCTHHLLAKSKAEAAVKRVNEINSSIVVQEHYALLDEKNTESLIDDSDVIVDCLDNLKTRLLLERAAKKIGSPLVSAAVAGAFGHVTSIFPEDRGLKLIYGESNDIKQKGAEASLGCIPYAVTLLASLETSEVVKILLSKGSVLRNKLLVADLMDNRLEVLDLL